MLFSASIAVIAPRPIDQEPNDANFIGVVIVVLTTIIILLVAIILFIVSRTKRARGSNVLDAFQYSFNPNTLGGNVDKHRPNGNSIKVGGPCFGHGALAIGHWPLGTCHLGTGHWDTCA